MKWCTIIGKALGGEKVVVSIVNDQSQLGASSCNADIYYFGDDSLVAREVLTSGTYHITTGKRNILKAICWPKAKKT